MNYKSEHARQAAVFKYFLVSWFATLATFGGFAAVCAATGILNVPLVLVLIAAQNISWIVCGTLMCAVFDSLGHPPTPKEKAPENHELKERIIPVYKGKRIG